MQIATLLAAFLALIPASAAAEARLVVHTDDDRDRVQHIIEDDRPITSARALSRTIYLNKNGVTLTPGTNDSRANRSSLVDSQVSMPPWDVSPALWDDTVSCLRDMFAPFDVKITDVDPGTVPHVEAVFSGSPEMLGLPPTAGGVAPFSTKCNIVENSVVFAFTDVIPDDAQELCEVMAQEIAHSYGLDHELLPSDPMTYLSYAGERTFQNTLAECGESSPRPCGVQGYASCRAKQNSYQLLIERLGPALGESAGDDDGAGDPRSGESADDDTGGNASDDADDSIGGCSVGGHAGGLLSLLVVGVARRLRNRRRATA